ncbi:MAG TPA: DNA-formamidopyrimidine glycosylase family protein [Thermoanaerobaculia bacterium]|nr:DNA-formamidopyrimidine glycosylase family protein [Thermoanaerobaculia bacterium]
MPELPEVELYARDFALHALHRTIAGVRVLDPRIAGTRDFALLRGRSFRSVRRHGKHLFADAGVVWLHIHFGMTGGLGAFLDEAPPRFARLVVDFQDGSHLAYADMRLFGVVELTASPEAFVREHRLGPDPLEIRLPEFRRRMAGRRGRIKALLMSQRVIAGVGNLYADEALYRASIEPRRAADRMTAEQTRRLFAAIRAVLREAIAFKSRGGDYPARWLVPHRAEGDRCPRCGGTIRRDVVGGRTTYWCARHQRQ